MGVGRGALAATVAAAYAVACVAFALTWIDGYIGPKDVMQMAIATMLVVVGLKEVLR